MKQCKKDCIDLDKIETVLKEYFHAGGKNIYESTVYAEFHSKKDFRLLIVKLIDNTIKTKYMYTNEKTKRANRVRKVFKTLEGFKSYVKAVNSTLK